VVYAKRPFRGPQHALRYLGAYTHRVAISNRKLVALENGNVTFRWRDSAHGNKKKLMMLPIDEFLRRFLLHLLPRGFVLILSRYDSTIRHTPILLLLLLDVGDLAVIDGRQNRNVLQTRPLKHANQISAYF
jgi:hypothetical protein